MPAPARTGCRPESTLTPLAFDRLIQWLDDGVDSHGDRFLEIHRRLVAYFDRHNRLVPEQLADETFRRIASTITTTGITRTSSPAHYCHVVARSMLLEDIGQERSQRLVGGTPPPAVAARVVRSSGLDDGSSSGGPRPNRLDRSIAELPAGDRQLIVGYYGDARRQAAGHHRRMAERMGISEKTLGVRAFQIRQRLMSCACHRS